MLAPLSFLSVLAGAATVAALDRVTSLNFQTDVLFQRATDWNALSAGACGTLDYYTSTPGSNLTVQFTGNKIVVDGMRNNASGVLEVQMDDNAPFTTKLYSDEVICGVFFEYDVGNGTHIVTLTLLDDDTEGRAFQPVLHVTTITYWTPDADDEVSGTTAVSAGHHRDIGAIVGGVVCGVVGLILAVGGVWWYVRRRKGSSSGSRRGSRGRHNYNPNTFFVTELSPRTASMPDPDAKLSPYDEMDDDLDIKSGGLDAPPPVYTLSTGGLRPPTGGLRARSRSPAPDRKGSI